MDDNFEIFVTYLGEELAFTSRLLMTGYAHKFEVQIGEQVIYFEPDDSGNYRAIVDQDQLNKYPQYDIGLLKAIAEVIESSRQ